MVTNKFFLFKIFLGKFGVSTFLIQSGPVTTFTFAARTSTERGGVMDPVGKFTYYRSII